MSEMSESSQIGTVVSNTSHGSARRRSENFKVRSWLVVGAASVGAALVVMGPAAVAAADDGGSSSSSNSSSSNSSDSSSASGSKSESGTKTVEEKGKVIRSERYYGSMLRSFSLGIDVDQVEATAKYADGILELTLPKKASSAAKKLTVK